MPSSRHAFLAAMLLSFPAGLFLPEAAGDEPVGVLPVKDDRIVLPGPITFKSGSADILPDSHKLLDSVAATLETHMDIARLAIGVHTDSRGSGAYNKRISQQRADAVLSYLAGKGLPRARLEAVGYGEERPIADNRTEEGRARNRRVEFVVTTRCPRGQVFCDGACKARAPNE